MGRLGASGLSLLIGGATTFIIVQRQHGRALKICAEALDATRADLDLQREAARTMQKQFSSMAMSLLLPSPQPAAPVATGPVSSSIPSQTPKEPPQGAEDEQVRDIDTPAARRALRVSLRGVNYPLFREMGLTKEDAEHVVDALVGIQGDLAKAASKELDPAQGHEIYHRALVNALGAERAGKYESLTESLPARAELRTLRNYLEDMGTPLSEEQQTKLLGMLGQAGRQEGIPATPNTAPQSDLLAQASDVLSEDQAKYLADFLPLIEHPPTP